jgi:hypothetical protein
MKRRARGQVFRRAGDTSCILAVQRPSLARLQDARAFRRIFDAFRCRLGRAPKREHAKQAEAAFLRASLCGPSSFGLFGRPALHAHSHRVSIATTEFSSE